MVKKTSSNKSQKAKTVEEKIEELASEPPKKEAPPHMMQVVEVMEEEIDIPAKDIVPSQEELQEEKKDEEEPGIQEEQQDKEVQQPTPAVTPESREVVSEFFAKKDRPASFGYPDISVHKKSVLPSVLLWALGVLVIVGIIGFIIIKLSGGTVAIPEIMVKPTPTPTVAPLPTATPTPAFDKTTLKIQVLNGSGIAGMAGKMKTTLEEKGYTVVGTGNAKTYEYEKTEIQTTPDVEAALSVLSADIGATYQVGSTAATLKTTFPYNVVVIVGKE